MEGKAPLEMTSAPEKIAVFHDMGFQKKYFIPVVLRVRNSLSEEGYNICGFEFVSVSDAVLQGRCAPGLQRGK